ncbi:MAG: hypothetical protein Q9165_006016 [Trypethelium subeluteriae]
MSGTLPTDAAISVEDNDPVKAEYEVYITPELGAQIYLLQYPNVFPDEPYTAERGRQPEAVRIKPKSGFIEVEIPVSTEQYFNKEKGIEFGQSLRKAKEEGSSSFGLANGFSGPKSRMRSNATGPVLGVETSAAKTSDESTQELLEDFESARTRGLVLDKKVLGGQILRSEAEKPIYMLGSFRGNELHLSQFSGVAQMRPQFHHIDAQWQLERNVSRREREAGEPPRHVEPRAVQMSFKPTGDDAHQIGTTDTLLKAAQEEKWMTLKHHDESAPESWNVYEKGLHVQEVETAPELVSSMTNDEYLDAISAPRPELNARKSKKAAARP